MTIALNPETEARLRERARRDEVAINETADALLSNVLVDDPAAMTQEEIEASYREMAVDKEREAEALEWTEGIQGRKCK